MQALAEWLPLLNLLIVPAVLQWNAMTRELASLTAIVRSHGEAIERHDRQLERQR